MSASTSIGVESFPSAMSHCPFACRVTFHSLLRTSYTCSLVAFIPTCLRHSGSDGSCTNIASVIVSWRACLNSAPHTVAQFPLLQNLTSVSCNRKLQLHQHRSVPSSVCPLPIFLKTSPHFESIHWIAQFRDHLTCSIFRAACGSPRLAESQGIIAFALFTWKEFKSERDKPWRHRSGHVKLSSMHKELTTLGHSLRLTVRSGPPRQK